MNTDTTNSIWLATSEQPAYQQNLSERDRHCDVAIVGAGITGLTAGLLLAQAGKHVVIVDKAKLAHGTTGFTTAQTTVLNDANYHDLISDFNRADAKTVAQACQFALERIAQWSEELPINCDFVRRNAYYFTENADEVKTLKAELDALDEVGVAAEWSEHSPLAFPIQGAVVVPNQARFNPVAYLHGLAREIIKHGGSIYENIGVTAIDDDKPCTLETSQGMIRAKQVIIATHMPINDVYVFAKLEAYRSYILGVRLNDDVPQGLFFDTHDPYYYINEYHDDQGPVMLVGGADHKTGINNAEQSPFEQLEQYVRQRFNVKEIAYRWSAQWYQSADGLPFIGAYPLRSHIFVATGFGGNGMTFGTLAGSIISDLILGHENPYAELFSLNRLKLTTSLPQMIKAGIESGVHFIKDRLHRDAKDLDAVGKNEGKLISLDGEQTAVYRDETGNLHLLSPVCTHLGCVVQWNDVERSWDCPCHGGRFSATGEPLEGPPTRHLAPHQTEE